MYRISLRSDTRTLGPSLFRVKPLRPLLAMHTGRGLPLPGGLVKRTAEALMLLVSVVVLVSAVLLGSYLGARVAVHMMSSVQPDPK